MKPSAMAKILCLALAFPPGPAARAEDIDLFAAKSTAALPNLIIILDNTANWNRPLAGPTAPLSCGSSISQSTRYCGVKTELYNAVESVSTRNGAAINVGLMLFNYANGKANTANAPTTNRTGNTDGAFVRFAVQPLDASAKTRLLNVIGSLDKASDQGIGNSQNALAMEEARRYYSGLTVLNGNNTFYGTGGGPQVLDTSAMNSIHTSYVSPAKSGCQANYVLYISNGPPTSEDAARQPQRSSRSTMAGCRRRFRSHPP